MKLSEFRRELKAIGFNIKTNTLSFGKVATYVDGKGKELPSIFTSESLEYWKPLIEFLKSNEKKLKEISLNENISIKSLTKY